MEEVDVVPTIAEATPAARTRRGARKPAEPVIDTRVGGHVVTRRGLVDLLVNGEQTPPIMFFGNVEDQQSLRRVMSEVRRAAAAGVHLYSTLVEIPCPLPPNDELYNLLDERLEAFFEADPEAYLIPRLVFVPAPGWMRNYPNEVSHYSDGVSADPSIASGRFWTDAEHALGAVIEHVQRTLRGDRVIGYHLERGEWFNPADNGYDRSFANREAFREWLRAKYKNSSVALRAAWYDGDVQFHTAEIPPLPNSVRPEMTFFEPRKGRRWIDFIEYTSDITADRLIALSKVVKQASSNRALVSVCYGYTFEFEHTFSGHLALGRVLAAPTIDIITGPPSYRDRGTGGAGSLPSPVDSFNLHGKLWVSEDDTKTHLAPQVKSPDDFNPKLDNRFATEQVHLRAVGKALAHQSGIQWMDLWGEGWLDGDDIWNRIGSFTRRYEAFLKSRKPSQPEVVVLVNEKSLPHVQRGPAFVKRLLQGQRDAIQRCGASVGVYLQSDVTTKSFPTDARLYVFLNPYRVPAEQRAAIKEKLQRDGKTLVWLYAVGAVEDRGEPEESLHDLIGITLRAQSWNMEMGSRLRDSRHPITSEMHGRELGIRERANPSFYVVDDDEPGLTMLADFHQSGLPSMAVREIGDWRSVFIAEPALNADLLRGLCRYAGVHLFSAGADDYVSCGNGWLTFHATHDGMRTIRLPSQKALYDLSENRLVAEDSSEYRVFMKGRTTHLFFVGTPDEMRKLGLPNVERRRGRAVRRTAEPSPVEELPTAQEVLPVEEMSPVEELIPVGNPFPELAPEPAFDGASILPELYEIEPEEAGEPVAAVAGSEPDSDSESEPQRRRRRRRGGRGRGRRGGNGDGADSSTEGSAGPAGDGASE